MTHLSATHRIGGHVAITTGTGTGPEAASCVAGEVAGEVELARYVYEPHPVPFEAPKPYVHPLRTLAGDVVTAYRPHDHVWHKGLQLTATDVSDVNIWGGHTYVAGEGYVALDNIGAMRPDEPAHVATSGADVTIHQDLTWLDAAAHPLVHEQRTLRAHTVDNAAGYWVLDITTAVTNVRGQPLRFGSPHTRGLAGSGYTGLWWRGPRSFTGGALLTASGLVDEDTLRGQSAPWVGYVGRHDEVDRSSTLVFCHAPENDIDSAHWFVRTGQFAGVNPSWAFHRSFDLPPEDSFRRRYRVVIGTGAWSAEHTAHVVEAIPW
ncbi:PmoA family protein [Phytoactinopolyspora limicola]|uniref:DUF6807 domain-containing protein n=1 Tax=Phytoactinopolyspora limicola TaxID=2715536 RepID=UPI001409DE7E|nr:PmoA family protein [Phytoactinopolyspora limicola]